MCTAANGIGTAKSEDLTSIRDKPPSYKPYGLLHTLILTYLVDHTGIEPAISCLQGTRHPIAPSGPYLRSGICKQGLYISSENRPHLGYQTYAILEQFRFTQDLTLRFLHTGDETFRMLQLELPQGVEPWQSCLQGRRSTVVPEKRIVSNSSQS